MTTPLAAVVLAHGDPAQLHRLVAALEDVPVVLHVDAATPPAVHRRLVEGLPDRVVLADRLRTTRASWSLVDVELAALERVLALCDAEHVAVLSGADLPALPLATVLDDLRAWQGRSALLSLPMPYAPWSTPRMRDGGLWRLRHRFLTMRGQAVYLRDLPLFWPVPRAIPADLVPRASSEWKVYARQDVVRLLRVTRDRPDLVRFWRSTLVPDESFAASMLASPRLFGADAMPVNEIHPWVIRWAGDAAGHTRWLADDDLPDLRANAAAAPPTPGHDPALPYRRWFARKFSDAHSAGLLATLARG